MRMIKWIPLLLIIASCSDPRCAREAYYCLENEEQSAALRNLSDDRLINVAEVDWELSSPPTSESIYEMHRRGEDAAKSVYYRYGASKPQHEVLDDMTRIFSRDWPVCTAWRSSAPAAATQSISASCFRVFKEPIELPKV